MPFAQIYLLEGRTEDQKRVVIEKITDALCEAGATQLSFFPSGLVGTPVLPLQDTPLPWIVQEIAARRTPSLRTETFAFDDLRRAHSVKESDRALGKLVVRL